MSALHTLRSNNFFSSEISGNYFQKKLKVLRFCMMLIVIVSFQSCIKDVIENESKPAESYSADFLFSYLDQICKTARTTEGFFPPQAARAYGYIGIANYEAVVHGIAGARSLESQLNGMSVYALPKPDPAMSYNWAIAANAATSRMFRYMFEKRLTALNRLSIDSLEINTHQRLAANEIPAVVTRSQKFGYDIADQIFEYSKTDGGHESYQAPFQLPYTIPSDEYCWVPTGAALNPLSPRWGQNRPFLRTNVTRTGVIPHASFSKDPGSEFYKEAMVVYNQNINNSFEQTEIARYWADDPFATCTPAGHTFNIMAQILKEEKCSLAKSSMGFAKMAVAENDAFIACWKGKYDYVLIRPVSYIRRYIDPNFNTVIGTPPFPAYTSGHSCEIGAGSRILTSLFTNGSGDYQFTDYSQLQYGFYARSFNNFNQMAEECANSRLYGGIHYPMDNSQGLQLGRAVGDNVNKEIFWPKDVK